ncbi:FxsA family protein [Actinokineospora sp. HBU206404]|uniref:FxsA family protein n=1 Tax=Actinokineospora xionganensis TaxID=2684470 RepID=A0ABR7L5C0_9PSEU|nr:FxsA family protein [Actinokineospora xionganensis]
MLLVLFLAVVAEITVMVTVGNLVGILPTILLLIAATVLGVALLRREGVKTIGALQAAITARRPPEREILDGVLVAAAGVLVILPGFISDILAILLLLPPTRAIVRRRLVRRAEVAVANRERRTIIVDSVVVDPDANHHGSSDSGSNPTIFLPESRRGTD